MQCGLLLPISTQLNVTVGDATRLGLLRGSVIHAGVERYIWTVLWREQHDVRLHEVGDVDVVALGRSEQIRSE